MIKCPRCERENDKNENLCKYCGYELKSYEERVRAKGKNEDIASDFVVGYNIFIGIFAILIFVGGIVIGQENSNLMLAIWITGIILLVIINLLKNIVDELRKMNAKIK